MNIIYIHTHDTGRYIKPYGYPADTENLMGLARESLVFRNAYCAGPTCSPSRAAMLTGTLPHTNGMMGLAHRGFSLSDPKMHLASWLAAHGFETVLCGVQHEASGGGVAELGYSRILNTRHDDFGNARLAADFIRSPHRKNYFLSFGLFHTHRPYPELKDSISARYTQPPHPIADSPESRIDMAAFYQSASEADACIGEVLDALRDSGQYEDSLVFYTTDHGIAFPWMKCNLYDTGIGVSLIMKLPDGRRAGDVTDALVSQLDLFPTVCDLIGERRPEWLQGVSLLPLFDGAQQIRSKVFAEVTYHAAYEPMRCVRTQRYKLIRRFDGFGKPVLPNIDAGPSKSRLLEYGLKEFHMPESELYDLAVDPDERNNLVGRPDYAEVETELNSLLMNNMRNTSDPLLDGKVPRPKGSIVNLQDALDPDKIHIEKDE